MFYIYIYIYIYIYTHIYIYHQLPPTCFGVCYTIFRETSALVAPKCCKKHTVFEKLT